MKTPSKWLENAISIIKKHDLEIARNETAILDILLEIETRKEYSAAGFDGLFSFCIRTFGCSESQTSTRTQAMYALKAVPEIKTKIDEGRMSVTTVAQVQRFVRQEQTEAGIERTPEQKRDLFESFQDKSSVQVKQEIAERRGERIVQKLILELDPKAEALWNQVRELSAHVTQGSALNCLKELMKTYVEQKQKSSRRSKSQVQPQASTPDTAPDLNTTSPRRTTSSSTKVDSIPPRFIPAGTRRQIFERDRHQCRNCGSRYALQIDHIRPVALGGTNEPDNLRVLCRNCNLHRATRDFGPIKTQRQPSAA